MSRAQYRVPGTAPGESYTTSSYGRAIRYAIRRHNRTPRGSARPIPEWDPNQVRHSAATRLRRTVGLDAARAILGHASHKTTEIYAEIDVNLAREAVARFG